MRTMITAHSGCEGRPDNSLEYVRYALTCGADALEVDVHPRGDSFCISHDAPMGNCPSLETVFSLVRDTGVRINCDLKEPGLEQGVLHLARSCGVEEQLLFSGTVSSEAMEDPVIRQRTFWNLESALPALLERSDPEAAPSESEIREAARLCKAHGAAAINLHYSICTPENLSIFQEAGVAVSAWTVNDPAEAQFLLDKGLFNITTRRPLIVCALRGTP